MLKIKLGDDFMNGEIKDYIINNFKDDDEKTIKNAIMEAINDNDEVALPGLGIFFYLNWQEMSDLEKEQTIKRIHSSIKKGNQN